jgi:putative hydrolase of the HAD superfamily
MTADRKKVLIADADNTLYSWVDYIVPSLEAMVDALARVTGFSRDDIASSMRKVFEKFNTNEYAFVLQEAEIFADLRKDFARFQEHVINPSRYAFNRAREQCLQPYPGVRKTLRHLVNRGIKIFVLSDAPSFSAEQRLKRLEISPYVTALYALKTYPLPRSTHLDEAILNRMKVGYYRSQVGKVVEMDHAFEKPNPEGLGQLLRRERIRPEQAVLVGDNAKKDIVVARACSVADVWARYGTVIAPEMRARLSYYSAPSVQRRNVSAEGEVQIVPTHTIDRFDQLLELGLF